MNALVADLVSVLDQESVLIRSLVQLLQDDQRRIIQQDIPALEESNRHKEEVVLRVQVLEQTRMDLTRRIGMTLGLAAEDQRVSRIRPLLGPEGKDLEDAAEKLRALVGSMQELVAVGRGFLEQSILGIRSLLALIHSLRTPDPQTYGSTGRIEDTSAPQAMAIHREA